MLKQKLRLSDDLTRSRVHLNAFLVACLEGHIETAQLLLEAGADKDQARTDGSTPLYIACKHDHIKVVRLLLEAGADKDQARTDGCTPLFAACQYAHTDVVQLLLEAGADKDQAANGGCTPLYTACQNACEEGHIDVVRLLLEAGADKDQATTNGGCTPLYAACQEGHIDVVQLLVEAGADKDQAANDGITPLHVAASLGHDTICMLLTFEGADLTARSSSAQYYNHTPADAAQFIGGHTSLAVHLRNSNGVRCLRCTGPSLERRLLWSDTNQQQEEMMLDEMQAQWLARVAEGCAHARIGLTLRGAFRGGLSTCMLLHVMGYVFGGPQSHLQSCISTGRVAPERGLATQAVAAVDAHGTKHAGSDRGRPMQQSVQHDQEQLPPKLALVSHVLAVAATPKPPPISCSSTGAGSSVLSAEARQQLQTALARLVEATKAAEGGCEWLHAYCAFLQRRHRLGS
jgi:ankyrin repeat protein